MSQNKRWQATVRTLEERFWLAGAVAQFGQEAGLSAQQQKTLGIVTAELASNAIKYAGGGTVSLSPHEDGKGRRGVVLEVEDQGPGIKALQEALQDGISEGRLLTPDIPQSERRGLGIGLGAVLRLADEVTFSTEEHRGTRIRAVFWVKGGLPRRP